MKTMQHLMARLSGDISVMYIRNFDPQRSLVGAHQSHVPKNKVNVQPSKALFDLKQDKFQVVDQIHDLSPHNGESCPLP